jgi:hypothetical protein
MTTAILSPTWLARLFAEGVEKHPLAEIAPGALTVRGKTGTQRLIYRQLDGVRVERGLFVLVRRDRPATTGVPLRLNGGMVTYPTYVLAAPAVSDRRTQQVTPGPRRC